MVDEAPEVPRRDAGDRPRARLDLFVSAQVARKTAYSIRKITYSIGKFDLIDLNNWFI